MEIVATIGPASFGLAVELAAAGATAFRLNASHMSPSDLDEVLGRLRSALPQQPVVVDLQGAKMRLGDFTERYLHHGDCLELALDPGTSGALPLPHQELFRCVEPDQTLSCDDDRLRLRVRSVASERVEVESLADAWLRPRKGINLLEHPVVLDDLSPRDVAHLELAARHPRVAFACSFVRDGSEAEWIRRRAPHCRVIGKVERRAALDQMQSIAAACDEIWICRGDLGAQLGPARLAAFVASFAPREFACPALMAGQVLEHLTEHAEPTRAEVCHLYDLVARGYAGIVLSDETAVGRDPVAATTLAAGLLRAFCGSS